MGEWIDLLDPTPEQLAGYLPKGLHESDLAQLRAKGAGGRPTLAEHGDHVFGVLLVAVVDRPANDIFYQEIDVLLTAERLVTIRKRTPGGGAFDAAALQSAHRPDESPALAFYRLANDIAHRYLDAVDDLDQEIGELEDSVEQLEPTDVSLRLRRLRHQILHVRRTLGPMRDAIRSVADGRVSLFDETGPRAIEHEFAGVHNLLLRATEGLELAHDLLSGTRDYYQAKVAQDQNEVVKRLTAVASIVLVPTLIVGFYGQNFHFPEQTWGWYWGYVWSLTWVLVVTVFQYLYFRRKNWL